ncbi:transglycosylase SLT domain-containing protein [Candidatus Parcubacteria bacterium]|nr:transglycosylase SLT domain-containing protein [Candidatus Parcubacteria bacterium]
MKQIYSLDKIQNLSEKNNTHQFKLTVYKKAAHLIIVQASAKNWRQNKAKFFDDDDLSIKIDGSKSAKLNKQGWFNAPASWNGNKLKGNGKICYFLMPLDKGEHIIYFKADRSPVLQSIKVFETNQEITLNNKLLPDFKEQGIYPIATIAALGVKINTIEILASADYQNRKENDNLKIIVDDQLILNQEDKTYKNWYWAGKILKGSDKKFKIENLDAALHYIELFRKNSPKIKEIKINIESIEKTKPVGIVALHQSLTSSKVLHLRKEATTESKSLFKMPKGVYVEILQERVKGEYVNDRSDIWHKVRCQDKIGHVLSSYIDIIGNGRDDIIQKIYQKVDELEMNEHLNLLLALASAESEFKPYAVSYTGVKGVFQLTGDARIQVKDVYGYIVDDPFNPDQNIHSGVLYFKWLYEDIYGEVKDKEDRIKKTVAGWNAGHGNFPANKSFSYDYMPSETMGDLAKVKEVKSFVSKVLKKRHRKNWILYCLALLIIPSLIFSFAYYKDDRPKYIYNQKDHLIFQDVSLETMEQDITFQTLGDNMLNHRIQLSYLGQRYIIPDYTIEKHTWTDLNNDGFKELTLQIAQGNTLYSRIFAYSQGNFIAVADIGKYGFSYLFSGALWKTVDGDMSYVVNIYRTFSDNTCKQAIGVFEKFDGQKLIYVEKDYLTSKIACPKMKKKHDLAFLFGDMEMQKK